MINTVERIAMLHEGGHPITVYSEEDANILVTTFKDKFKRKKDHYSITNKGKKWIVDYIPSTEEKEK